jgi:hypothetical protein
MTVSRYSRKTLPPGTASLFHLHRDSDEVPRVLASEFSFIDRRAAGPAPARSCRATCRNAWKNTGSETGRMLFI